MTEEEAMATWKRGYKQHGWSKIAGMNRYGGIPRAYVLPKSKDLRKGRPIVPYCNHLLRPIYRLAGRSLSYFLSHDTDQNPDQNPDQNLGFNMTRTDEYLLAVKRQSKAAEKRYSGNLRW